MIFFKAKCASEFSDLERKYKIWERLLDLNAASKIFYLWLVGCLKGFLNIFAGLKYLQIFLNPLSHWAIHFFL